MAIELRDKTIGGNENPKLPEYKGRKINFEGIDIQWEKGEWDFQHPTLGKVTKATYPLLNPLYWSEIAQGFHDGQTAAVFMMGNFGVVKRLENSDWEQGKKGSADTLFDRVKKRPRQQNFVAFVDPEDIIDIIDVDRIDKKFKNQLRFPGGRKRLYPGPLHIILPVREGFVNKALIREEDKTIAVFWAHHFGFEGLVDAARRKIKHGTLGGGSLNIHGKEPCYNKTELYQEMVNQPDWLEEIDFIVFDDIVEAAGIGRSHTMVRYSGQEPELVRLGSLSRKKIEASTGRIMTVPSDLKYASSKTPYSEEFNALADRKVEEALLQVGRFENYIKSSINF